MKGKMKKIILLLVIVGLFAIYFFSLSNDKGLRIVKWDNYYQGESIETFYEPLRKGLNINEKLTRISNIYKVPEIAGNEKSEMNKILKASEILNTIVTPDDVTNTNYVNAYDILNSKGESKKVSKKDCAIILRDLILSLGYESRIGVFRKEKPQFENSPEYYLVEYWSPEYNKWIMVDFVGNSIPMINKEPLGAIDLINMSDIGKVEFINISGEESNTEIRSIKKYLSSYSIPIDNTINRKYSNSYITYVSDDKDLDFIAGGSYVPPTIYTKEKALLEASPFIEKKNEDDKAYLIFMKKSPLKKPNEDKTDEEKEKDKYEFIVDSFKNGSTIKDYYLNINGKGFEKVQDYKEITFEEGKNTIELSLDGKETVSSIEVIRDKV